MSIFFEKTKYPFADALVEILLQFWSKVFLRQPKTYLDCLETLDDYWDQINENKVLYPWERMDASKAAFHRNWGRFVAKYIYLDKKYLKDVESLTKFFEEVTYQDVFQTLFGKRRMPPSCGFFWNYFSDGFYVLEEKGQEWDLLVERFLNILQKQFDLWPEKIRELGIRKH